MDAVAAVIPTIGMLILFTALLVTAFRATDRSRRSPERDDDVQQ